jgi:hypothetical protein
MTLVEYASLAELQRRDVDSNGLDREAAAELRRRWLGAKLGGATGRDPHQALAELARLADPRDPRDAILELYAAHGPTRDPHEALLMLHAAAIVADDVF